MQFWTKLAIFGRHKMPLWTMYLSGCCCYDEPVRRCLYGGTDDPKRWGIPPDSHSPGTHLWCQSNLQSNAGVLLPILGRVIVNVQPSRPHYHNVDRLGIPSVGCKQQLLQQVWTVSKLEWYVNHTRHDNEGRFTVSHINHRMFMNNVSIKYVHLMQHSTSSSDRKHHSVEKWTPLEPACLKYTTLIIHYVIVSQS